ncbi:hypothetical protein LWI29_013912 [Acer saccharum]|uniref:Uncharacterized protein n=1 Tax=Acer saccharum TaxID=4024 RepID=A0AA39VX59_ACESA|nr:hypothetical protein LWI29_013912 [Acer saccharum]
MAWLKWKRRYKGHGVLTQLRQRMPLKEATSRRPSIRHGQKASTGQQSVRSVRQPSTISESHAQDSRELSPIRQASLSIYGDSPKTSMTSDVLIPPPLRYQHSIQFGSTLELSKLICDIVVKEIAKLRNEMFKHFGSVQGHHCTNEKDCRDIDNRDSFQTDFGTEYDSN